MCFRWVEDSENWLAVGSPKTCLFRKGSSGIAGHLASSVLGRWWVPVLSIVSRPAHRIPPVSCTSLLTQSWWPMHRCLSQPTTSPHCLALTLSRSTRSHTVSLYLALTLSHVRFRTSCHMVSSSVNVSHRLALFRIHLTVCHATGQFNAPTLSHAHFDAPFNAQVTRTVAAPTVAAHTLLRQPQLHYWCTIQHSEHTAHHINRCCTYTAPYSTPLGTPTSAAPITTEPSAAAPTTVAPTTAALA